ncbi:ribonuclease Z [Fodinisporobacter ferrooxydans]|uniref:Ribonuclease Z n=1 Tax=Fodinisporobacter ferrooxydans TaxID=2901836 RepID=A0ABY4CMF9_9BACL|nr:ribonuclease Z [Alicyclobacillaceae bacterium MYW30-H2]
MFEVCLLGCGGSLPLPERSLTALLASYNGKMILIDCGEGTQVSMRQIGWGFKAIEAICFTHYHADHIIGLPGILLTIGNSGRQEPLTLIGPPGLREVITGLLVIAPRLPFELHLIELPIEQTTALQLAGIDISILPVYHHVPCVAYRLEIKRGRKFLPERAKALQIPVNFWKSLQQGHAIRTDGTEYTPDMVLGPARNGIRLAYCTDTRPLPAIADFIRESDLFICEGMYGSEDKYENALENRHMLFREAAELAKVGQVRELWLTHFSPSMPNPSDYLTEATKIFPNTKIGFDRMITSLHFPEE